MIPKADIVAWRQFAPWVTDAQVEQDLIICRALVSIFHNSFLAERLAFRGGTALHKLYFSVPRRYSEDIDLVQITPAPIGQIMDTLQELLNGFLGVPRRKQTEESVILTYRMESEGPPVVQMRLKVEINTREHFAVEGYQKQSFTIQSRWFQGRYEKNLQEKMRHQGFLSDLNPLLPADATYDVQEAYVLIKNEIVDRIESTSK